MIRKKDYDNGADIHCHILPGIDDGAPDTDASIDLIRAETEQGVKDFIFTPHFYPERMTAEEFICKRGEASSRLDRALKDSGLDFIHYRLGAEIHYSPMLDTFPLDQLCFQGTCYLLLELQDFWSLDAEELIRRLKTLGYTPILAHIERFPYLMEDPAYLYQLVKAGALAQINAGWVIHDKSSRKWLEKLWDWKLVHFMASDTHSITRRPPNLLKGYKKLPGEMGDYFRNNSRAVFAGETVSAREPRKPQRFLSHWR